MSDRLKGQACLVTGASKGIGAAIAAMMAAQGARVAVHYGSDRRSAEKVVAQLSGDGHIVLGADLSAASGGADLVTRALAGLGRLDVVVNNAGIYQAHPPLETSAEEWLARWQETLAVNLIGPAAICQAAAKIMAEQGNGRIINIGSRGAFRGEPEGPAYGASKAGLHAMSQSLAMALAPSNVQVFAVAPGFVDTEMARELLDSDAGDGIRAQSPMKRVGRPDEIAELVCFLASTEASYMTGSIIDVNGASYLRH